VNSIWVKVEKSTLSTKQTRKYTVLSSRQGCQQIQQTHFKDINLSSQIMIAKVSFVIVCMAALACAQDEEGVGPVRKDPRRSVKPPVDCGEKDSGWQGSFSSISEQWVPGKTFWFRYRCTGGCVATACAAGEYTNGKLVLSAVVPINLGDTSGCRSKFTARASGSNTRVWTGAYCT
jgi:hypothetical protein